jgi:hypothetical protein
VNLPQFLLAIFDFGYNKTRLQSYWSPEKGRGVWVGGVGSGNGFVVSTSAGSSALNTRTPWIGFEMTLFVTLALSL